MKIKTNIHERITTIRPTNLTYIMVVTFKFAKTLPCDVKLLSNAVLLGNDEIYGVLPPNDNMLPCFYFQRSYTVTKNGPRLLEKL